MNEVLTLLVMRATGSLEVQRTGSGNSPSVSILGVKARVFPDAPTIGPR